jgi:dienelactone hydrolase
MLLPQQITQDGAFMEQSGRNPWQQAANGTAEKTAQICENRCSGLLPVARRSLRAAGVSFRPLSLERDRLVGRYWTPAGGGRRSAVLTLGGSEGGLHEGTFEQLLASRGYPVLQLAYFGLPGLPPTLERIPLEYFEQALTWLAEQPQVDRNRIVLIGSSRGAELALLLGARYPSLVHSVAAYAPSSVVNAGFPGWGKRPTEPAWTHEGKAVPFVRDDEWGNATPEKTPNAVIPVEQIRGSILLVSGLADNVWPSASYASAIADRLRAHARRGFASIVSSYGGHGVAAVIPFLPLATSWPGHALFGDQNADARARTTAWPRLLALLDRPR